MARTQGGVSASDISLQSPYLLNCGHVGYLRVGFRGQNKGQSWAGWSTLLDLPFKINIANIHCRRLVLLGDIL